jgi:hypothetical protein
MCSHVEVDHVSEVRTTSTIIILTVKAVRTSEMSVHINVTAQRYIAEDS